MAGTFDPVLKVLVETEPEGWLPIVGRPVSPVSVIDADVSAVITGAVDKVLLVRARQKFLLHLDFQSRHDSAKLPRRLRGYNVVLEDRHELPVWSVGFILRPEADSPQLTGLLETGLPDEESIHRFRYGVVRIWQLPAEALLTGGVGLLPLAPVSDANLSTLSAIVRRMKARLRRDARARELWAAAYVLLGLR